MKATDAPSPATLLGQILARWRQRYVGVTSVVDRCDAARAYEVQNFIVDLERLEAALRVSGSQQEKPDVEA